MATDGLSPRNRLFLRAGAVLAGVLAIVVGAVVWQGYRRQHAEVCPFSDRPIHSGARAVVEVAGERLPTCCIRCALTAERQGVKARLVEVSDFASGAALAPEAAFYVSGSPVVLCERHEPKLDAEKHVYQPVFDRCEPSILAFGRREQAEEFARRQGGAVRRLPEILQEAGVRP